MSINLTQSKKQFIELLQSTQRDGVDDLIVDLEKMGFFTAPASASHHLNTEGGLVEHSLNTCHAALIVWEGLCKLDSSIPYEVERDNVIIASLLHDVCKSDIYERSVRKRKNALGIWEPTEGYRVTRKNFPMGHGEKSAILVLCSGIELTDAEMLAIRWHMGAWSLNFQSMEEMKNMEAAKKLHPLVTIVQTADSLATSIIERKTEEIDDI